MDERQKYMCSTCGIAHTEWPALAFNSPAHYIVLSDEEKNSKAEISEDICVIDDGGEIHRFIRCSLYQKVNDHCEDLNYGLWVSLSEKSFEDYTANYGNESYEAQYFAWLCNNIPEYNFEESIPTTVVTQKGGLRPVIFPHESFEHPFVKDFYNGITKIEAEKRIADMMEDVQSKIKSRGAWWKFW